MKVTILIATVLTCALAEPPVNNNYLPPNQQYGAPQRPSSQYGLPNGQTAAIIKPNIQYGAPRINQQYGAPDQGFHGNNGGYNNNQGYNNNDGYNNNGGGAGGYGRGGYDEGPSEPANYNFEYHVQDDYYGTDFGHQESRQGDETQGKYYVLLPDGRRQIVEYVADQNGYRPKISYEGTARSDAGGYGKGGAGGYNDGGAAGGYNNGGGGGYNKGGYQDNGYQNDRGNGGYNY